MDDGEILQLGRNGDHDGDRRAKDIEPRGRSKGRQMLEMEGYVVEERVPPRLSELAELWMSILHSEIAGPAREGMNAMGSEGFRRSFTDTAACLPILNAGAYQAAWQRRHVILREWSVFLETYPVVLTPTSCQPTYPVDHDMKGLEVMAEILRAYSPLSAIAGAGLPVMSAPVGPAAGAPAGVQIITSALREERCQAVAAALEKRIGSITPITPTVS